MANSGSKGLSKKVMKGKGKYLRYRNSNKQVKHCVRRILNSQGLQAAEQYCKQYEASTKLLIAPIVASCKQHTAQTHTFLAVEEAAMMELPIEQRVYISHRVTGSTVFYG